MPGGWPAQRSAVSWSWSKMRAAWRPALAQWPRDLLARDDRFWQLIGHPHRLSFAEAAKLALDGKRRNSRVQGIWGAIERVRGPSKSSA
jgi:hypothetical protein